MKLGFQILILMVFCFSCKDEKVFDSSPSERNANHIGELRKDEVCYSVYVCFARVGAKDCEGTSDSQNWIYLIFLLQR